MSIPQVAAGEESHHIKHFQPCVGHEDAIVRHTGKFATSLTPRKMTLEISDTIHTAKLL